MGQGDKYKMTEVNKETEETKTFTQEEVEKMIQAESDKRVNQALEKKQTAWETDYKAKIEEEKRQAQLSEEEKWQEKFKAQVSEFESERLEFQQAKLKASAIELLAKESLPTNFVDFIIGNDEETTVQNIASLKEEWSNELTNAVNERLKGKTPPSGNASTSITKEDIKKMSYKEKVEFQQANPALYKELTK